MAKQDLMRQRITKLLKQLGECVHEREQVLAIALLGAIAGSNTLMFGRLEIVLNLILETYTAPTEIPGKVAPND